MADAVRVRGLRELNLAFAQADKTLIREKRDALRRVADPVASDAEHLALIDIDNIGIPWSRMRIGVTQRSVYVAPAHRATRSPELRRPNLAPLLLDKMETALEHNAREVERELEDVLDQVGRVWERA